MIRRLLAAAMVSLLSCSVSAMPVLHGVAGNASHISQPAPIAPVSSFITVAASDLSAATKTQMPHVYLEEEVDRTGWPVVDVTSQASIDAGLGVSACAPMVCNGTTDDAPNFFCMWNHANADSVTFELPAFPSICQIDSTDDGSRNFFRPITGKDRRATVSDTPGTKAHVRIGSIHPDIPASSNGELMFLEGEAGIEGANLGWTGGFTRGTTDITLTSVTGLAVGEYLYLHAEPNAQQPLDSGQGAEDRWTKWRASKVTNIAGAGPFTVTLDRPLPDDFTGTDPQAQEWTPAVGWHFEDLSIYHEFPDHQSLAFSGLMVLTGMAESSLKNVDVDGYQFGISIQQSARIRMERVKVSNNFDKLFNNSGLIISGGSSGITFLDSIAQAAESFACAGNSQSILVAFSLFPDMEDNQPAYDRVCPGGICSVDFAAHSSVHGSTGACIDVAPADGQCDARTSETNWLLHCSSGDDGDMLGVSGSAGCHGTPSDVPAGAILLHNNSCSNMMIVRSQFETGIWRDYTVGPGRYNAFIGVLGLEGDSGVAVSGGGVDNGGDSGRKYVGGAASPNYEDNFMIIASTLRKLGGGSAGPFDVFMDGARYEYSAFRDSCEYSGNDSTIDAACADVAPGWRFGRMSNGGSSTTRVTSTGRVPTRDMTGLVLWNVTDAASCIVTGQSSPDWVECSGGLSGGASFDDPDPGNPNDGDEWAVSGGNIFWSNMTVGNGTSPKDFTGVDMPTAPGFTECPSLGGSGTCPHVGADRGAVTPGGSQDCLPAYERHHGSC